MEFPQDVNDLLHEFTAKVREALGENLVGVYLRGSLAMGEFNLQTSDVDVLVVTESRIDEVHFSNLAAMHEHLSAGGNPFAKRVEVAYIDRASLRKYQPGLRHPTLYQGETLEWAEHQDNWILERWTMREHGEPLVGPDPKSLIDRIKPEELRDAVRRRMVDWIAWANDPNDSEWKMPRSQKAYVIETMCRALYTLKHSRLCSKPHAVRWAMATLPPPWRELVEESQPWRADFQTVDPSLNSRVRDFILWCANRAADGGH